jgi:hypothetical protein
MTLGYDTRERRDRGYRQPLPDYRMQERVAWQALQDVAQRLLAESARLPGPTRRFSTLLAYAQAQRAWRGARYALDLAAVAFPRGATPPSHRSASAARVPRVHAGGSRPPADRTAVRARRRLLPPEGARRDDPAPLDTPR